MKKIIAACLILLSFSTTIDAQWTKVLGKSNVPELTQATVKYGIHTWIGAENGMYYSNDEGNNWTILRPNYFKATDTLYMTSCIANEVGLFSLVVKMGRAVTTNYVDSVFFVFTPDLGRTWEVQYVVSGDMRNYIYKCRLFQSKNYIHAFLPYPAIVGYLPRIFKARKNTRQIEYSDVHGDRNASLYVTDSAEYIIYYPPSAIDINYHDGRKVVKRLSSYRGGHILTDSLMYITSWPAQTVEFSKDFGTTWYYTGPSLPKPRGDREEYIIFSYKNKIYCVVDAKVYSSTNSGLSWVLESSEIEKNLGPFNPKMFILDSILTFSNSRHNAPDKRYSYNILTKKLTYLKTEIVSNQRELNLKDKIVKLNDGKLLKQADFNPNPYSCFLSNDAGATWQLTSDYPFFFDKIQLTDSSFYALDRYNGGVFYIVKFVNGLRRDTLVSSTLFYNYIQKQDTIVSRVIDSVRYFPQKPYDSWRTICDISAFDSYQFFFFNDKKIYLFFNTISELSVGVLNLDGHFEPTLIKENHSFLLNASEPNSIWVGNDYAIYNTKDLGITKRSIPIPVSNNSRNGTYTDAGMLAVIKKANIPEEKVLLIAARNTPYLTIDSGKTWIPFNLGMEDAVTFKVQQVDNYLFAITDRGMYRRRLDDINLRSVAGSVFQDANNNNVWDMGEQAVSNAKIQSKISGAVAYTDSLGKYSLISDASGLDTIVASFDNKYATILPNFYLSTQSDTGKNFAVRLVANVNDVKGVLTAFTAPRPGFNNTYSIDFKNVGSTIANGKVTLKYHNKQTFINATATPTSHTNATLIWNYTDLRPNESRMLGVTFNTATDAPIGSKITDVLTVDPLSIDTFKMDNIDSLVQIVVGSFDPNDKQVRFENNTTPSVISPSTALIYTIRFQNTGNYPADFVKIVDTLSDKLDLTTFRLIATSHTAKVAIRDKNVLTIDFKPIYLPDSMRDEAASHGFVTFAIQPKKTLVNTESIKNTGYIYFDYNEAVVTNTIEAANVKGTGIFTPSVSAGKLTLSPNPTQYSLRIEVENLDFKEGLINIYDVSGRLVLSKSINQRADDVNIQHLKNGEYICILQFIDNKMFVNKFVKID